jgi:hypothetical protein
MANPAGAKLLGLGRNGQERIDLPVDEQSHRIGCSIIHPVNVLLGIEADKACHQSHKVLG